MFRYKHKIEFSLSKSNHVLLFNVLKDMGRQRGNSIARALYFCTVTRHHGFFGSLNQGMRIKIKKMRQEIRENN